MAAFFHIGRSTVSRYLKAFNIPERNISETRKIKKWSPSEEQKQRLSELGKSQIGKNNPTWKGGTWIDDWGYRRIRINGKYIKEHRYLMSQHLNRSLNRNEHVHHINGNKLDNRIENLIILSPSEHSSLHWDDDKRHSQSERIKKARADRFWSTRKLPE